MSLAIFPPAKDLSAHSLSDRIYNLVLGRMQRGEISPTERLIDSALAEQFGVSRMPARDALMRLSHQGYLEQTTRGFVLPRLGHRAILEIFELRRLMEPHAVAMATQALTPEQLAAMEQALAAARAAQQSADTEALFRASETMRNGWLAAVPNTELRTTIGRYMMQIQIVRMFTFSRASARMTVVAGYADIIAAFKARDGVAAATRQLRFVFEGEAAYRESRTQQTADDNMAGTTGHQS
jgi:DNA-binding GntR family transcriptional regulator